MLIYASLVFLYCSLFANQLIILAFFLISRTENHAGYFEITKSV